MSTHAYEVDDRNDRVVVSVNGDLVDRRDAVVSVFDAGFVLGDGVWEGMRLHNGTLAFLDAHLDRLFEGAAAIDVDIGRSRADLTDAIYAVTAANGMTAASGSGVHVRLMVTRGVKRTPHQDPRLTIGPATIVIVAEWKRPDTALSERGVRLFTTHVRRGAPDVQDPKWNSHSKLNDVVACIQAAKAGADEALMLDPDGFVATCNSTHFFVVRDGEVWTSTGDYCLLGITRANILTLCADQEIPAFERRFSLTQVYSAHEAFVTGTFGGVVPVVAVDGRTIGARSPGPMTTRLRALYADLLDRECPPRTP